MMKPVLRSMGVLFCGVNLLMAQLDSVVTTNIVYVAKNGNDATGLRSRMDKPFASVIAANNAAQSGDAIFVLPGDYLETNSIVLKEGVSLYGKGTGSTTLRATNISGGSCLVVLTNSHHTIQNLTLVATGCGIGCNNVTNSIAATNIVLRNLDVTVSGADALIFWSAAHTVQLDAYDCKFKCEGNIDLGIDLILTTPSKVRLFNCEASGNLDGLVLLNNSGTVEIFGGVYSGSSYGIIVSGQTANVYVHGAKIRAAGTDILGDNGTMTVSHSDFNTSMGTVNFADVQGKDLIANGKTVYMNGEKTVFIKSGAGSPEGVAAGSVGSMWLRTDGGTGSTLYIKESGTGNTGWVAK